jgi:hypothetical protein
VAGNERKGLCVVAQEDDNKNNPKKKARKKKTLFALFLLEDILLPAMN